MSKAILLRGNSGSGKSTVAKMLQRRFGRGTLMIPQDVVRRELLWSRDGAGNPAVALMSEMARWGAQSGRIVIVEGILDAEVYEPLFRTLDAKFDQVFAYYYDIPFEETLKRHETKPNRADFGEEDMRRWWKEKDFIGWMPERVIGADMSVDEAVESIFSDVMEG
ncbi:MAG: kinase [Clostridia bacterium]|nr:kinase [Clostridia bacterium]